MSIDEFIRFYKETHLPIYSDVVGYLGDKPRQILVEIENIFTHYVRWSDASESAENRSENLKRAHNHLVRVTIDCYKILWIEIKNDIVELDGIQQGMADSGVSSVEFFAKKQEFKQLSMHARSLEMAYIGTKPTECIAVYEAVINLGWDILGKFKDLLIRHQASKTVCTGDDPPTHYSPPFKLASTIEEGINEL